MPYTFRKKSSYRNMMSYEVNGHPSVTRIETYRMCDPHWLHYLRQSFDGTDEEFNRFVVARLGGAAIRGIGNSSDGRMAFCGDFRWPEDLYQAFVRWLDDEHRVYMNQLVQHREKFNLSFEEYPTLEMTPIPRPIFFNSRSSSFENEPWFQPRTALTAIAMA
jgi:hypothetical protein